MARKGFKSKPEREGRKEWDVSLWGTNRGTTATSKGGKTPYPDVKSWKGSVGQRPCKKPDRKESGPCRVAIKKGESWERIGIERLEFRVGLEESSLTPNVA